MKYEKKLQKLQEKLKFAYTKEVKEKLRRAIEKSKTKFLTRIKDEYIKIEMNYLIGRILDLL
jgi:rRNA-processing protein FCF1